MLTHAARMHMAASRYGRARAIWSKLVKPVQNTHVILLVTGLTFIDKSEQTSVSCRAAPLVVLVGARAISAKLLFQPCREGF